MSMTPQVPNFSQSMESAKSFWRTKQGTFGFRVLAVAALIVGTVIFFNLASILAFFSTIVWAGVNLIIASAVLTVLTSPLWCPPVRVLLRNMYQSSVRWSYRKFVQKDPIGTLLNNRDNVRDEVAVLSGAVGQLAGSKEGLETDIQAQLDLIRKNKSNADSCARKIADMQVALPKLSGNAKMEAGLELQTLGYTKQTYETAAGIAKQTIDAEKKLLEQTDRMYEDMSRLRNLGEYKVQSLTMQADMYAKQRKSILAGQKGLLAGQRFMNGDTHQLDLMDMAIETLNNETADTIGAMKDFNRTIGKRLVNMDIEMDAQADGGRNVFAELEQKLALPPESIVGVGGAMPTVTDEGLVIPSDNDYMKFLK